jgi:molybdopterin converting factor small subunit
MNSLEIRYMQPLTRLFSKRSENLDVPHGTTLSKVLDNLFSTYREQFKKYEIDPTSEHIVIILNGKTVPPKELDIELKDKDSLVLCMPVAGG